MTTKTARPPARTTLAAAADDPEKALANLRAAHAVVKTFDRAPAGFSPMDRAVAACRAAGLTWYVIADELNQHQPNVLRKYGNQVKALLALGVPTPPDHHAALATLRATATAARKAKDARVVAVAACRQALVTWHDIAEVVGQRPTNAVQTYGKLLEQRVQVVVREKPSR